MTEVFDYHRASGPILLSSPHDGAAFPEELVKRYQPKALENEDRDWFVTELYSLIENSNISFIKANYSRYVVDLNRSYSGEVLYPGQMETGLCPLSSFSGKPLYEKDCAPSAEEIEERIEQYWLPYHQHIQSELERIKSMHGYALLWDAHSIKAEVPGLFSGVLPDLNFGTNSGKSCDPEIARSLVVLSEQQANYRVVKDARFKGGYITRNYGRPEENVHAVQLEINQSTYLKDSENPLIDDAKQGRLSTLLVELLECFAARSAQLLK